MNQEARVWPPPSPLVGAAENREANWKVWLMATANSGRNPVSPSGPHAGNLPAHEPLDAGPAPAAGQLAVGQLAPIEPCSSVSGSSLPEALSKGQHTVQDSNQEARANAVFPAPTSRIQWPMGIAGHTLA